MQAIEAFDVPKIAGGPNVVRGERIEFARQPSGVLVVRSPQTLLRAENPKVPYWQVSLSPVTRRQVGSDVAGLLTTITTGGLQCQLTWGGGGANFRTRFDYPVMGSSFVVAGDNVMLDVFATDGVTVFTDDNAPVINGWVAERAEPTATAPMIINAGQGLSFFGPLPIQPWSRALHLFPLTASAIFTVTFAGASGSAVFEVTATGPVRIPIPNFANLCTILIAGSGSFSAGWELAFT